MMATHSRAMMTVQRFRFFSATPEEPAFWVSPPPNISDADSILSGTGLQFNLTSSILNALYAIYDSPMLVPTQNWQIVTGTEVVGTGGAIDLSITNGLLPTNNYRIGYTLP